jgi:hypothetical protein
LDHVLSSGRLNASARAVYHGADYELRMHWDLLAGDLITLGSVVIIDLVLAGDNAIVVGMAACGLPAADRRRVIFWGIAVHWCTKPRPVISRRNSERGAVMGWR